MSIEREIVTLDDRVELERFLYEDEDLERLEGLLDEFNPFEAMRWTRQELRHSAFLRWILDPNETHGMQAYCLRTFLKWVARAAQGTVSRAPSVIDVDGWEFQDTQIVSEWEAIDLLMRDDHDRFVAIIENKIDTTEHSEQLTRYRTKIEQRFPDYRHLFVYLTPDRAEPSDPSYVTMSYSDVASLIGEALRRKEDQLNPQVRDFAEHYVELLRRRIVEDSEIQHLCRRIYSKHRRALDVLFEFRPDRQQAVTDLLVSMIESTPELVKDHCTKAAVRFFISGLDTLPKLGEGWTSTGRLLLFEFETSGGLNLKLVLGPGPNNLRDEIHRLVTSRPDVFNKADQRLYPKWWTFHSDRWLGSKKLENLDMAEIEVVVRERFSRFVETELPALKGGLAEVVGLITRQSNA